MLIFNIVAELLNNNANVIANNNFDFVAFIALLFLMICPILIFLIIRKIFI